MKWLPATVSLIVCILFFWVFDRPHAPDVPFAPGHFFNPFSGFWTNGEQTLPVQENFSLPELKEAVVVRWDDRGVPHIFAQNDHDLYFVQGFIEARDRLWQMEFLTYVASGRLAEIFGNQERIVAHDRFRRRVGMVYAAENALKKLRQDDESYQAVEAYSKGVNSWIRQLTDKTLPLEYKIFNYRPEIWTPLKTTLILKFMAWDLTGRNEELAFTQIRKVLGDAVTKELFEAEPYKNDPIIPPDTPWNFKPLRIPTPPDSLFSGEFSSLLDNVVQPDKDNGSNNWVVSGNKTASGKPILANDPHLRLTLPAIWYEIQLVSPTVNVYGATLPGSPAVIIGFNEKVAWGVTNAGTDVMDWYKIKFKNKNATEYFYDGKWLPTEKRLEAIKIKGAETLFDTVMYTHHGPVSYLEGDKPFGDNFPINCALRWTAHDPSNELRVFLNLNRAKDLSDYLEAMKLYECPAQNFVFASLAGDIAIRHNGKFPLRWSRQGRYISDGTDARYDWQGYIPYEHLPASVNPKRGFLASANQKPVAQSYPYVMTGKYATFERGARIHERLSQLEDITPQGMMRLQLDNLNLKARTTLPMMLSVIDSTTLSGDELKAYRSLQNWDYQNLRGLIAPTVFEYWFKQLVKDIWDDNLPGSKDKVYLYPEDDVTMRLLAEDTSAVYFDNRLTDPRESYHDIVQGAFRQSVANLKQKFGQFGDKWQWGSARGTDITHLAQVPGLGITDLPTDGNHAIVNAIRELHGPSWRMIVQLDEKGPQAWGVYPGGQSGNPGSSRYDQFVKPWLDGLYYELLYLKSPNDVHERLVGKTIFQNTSE